MYQQLNKMLRLLSREQMENDPTGRLAWAATQTLTQAGKINRQMSGDFQVAPLLSWLDEQAERAEKQTARWREEATSQKVEFQRFDLNDQLFTTWEYSPYVGQQMAQKRRVSGSGVVDVVFESEAPALAAAEQFETLIRAYRVIKERVEAFAQEGANA